MRFRAAMILLGGLASAGTAQTVVHSPQADKVAVTVYRDPNGSGAMDLGWLEGFAMVSETRRVSIPAGESDIRFEGVASGLIPQSATIEGLGDSVIEKNRDARLLSPGNLLGGLLGQRVHLRRTSRATGKIVEQEAVVRAAPNGVVIQTDAGIEAMDCSGLSEALLPAKVPADLSAKPTLSVRVRAAKPTQATVKLTYITTNFDWRAHYVATLAPDGKSLRLFAWLTMANGDETGFRDAEALAVAGRLNREDRERLEPAIEPIRLQCWPQGRTHEIPLDLDVPPPPPPPPPSAPMMEMASPVSVVSEDIVVTGSKVQAQREDLGDLKLYRIPIPVTVASQSQKQVAMIEQPAVRFEQFYRGRTWIDNRTDEPEALPLIIRFQNRAKDGLGLPLPSGQFTLYGQYDGRPFLLGEGRMTDRAVNEQVDVELADAPGVRFAQKAIGREDNDDEVEIRLTSDLDRPAHVEIRVSMSDDQKLRGSPLVKRDGEWWWIVDLPANGERAIRLRYRDTD
ncbi:DUF4139 domain-containing protein [Sphingomonas jaspsi]|uniref:DUF4139 domain-containing protein n=1 Tax=Sphingomonas jaspsi TaxID=392409 RepID=UPI0004B01325|nr:hypothetical protein [Sphingomonas jaspsi]